MTPLDIVQWLILAYLVYATSLSLRINLRNEASIDDLRLLIGCQATRSAAEFTAAEHERQLLDEDRERHRLMPLNAGRTDQNPLIR
jgi:hypothetical protein